MILINYCMIFFHEIITQFMVFFIKLKHRQFFDSMISSDTVYYIILKNYIIVLYICIKLCIFVIGVYLLITLITMDVDIKLCKSSNQTWGIRLSGGADFSFPLTVVRVTCIIYILLIEILEES